MLWMNDGAGQYTSKSTLKWRQQMGLLCMDWPAQLLDLNLIANLCCIIKICDSTHCHQVYAFTQKKVIQNGWDKLTEEKI